MNEPVTLADLWGAPLVGLDLDDMLSQDRSACWLCQDAPGTLALGYHPGVFCDPCMTHIWSGQTLRRDGTGCSCGIWTPRAREMHLNQVNRTIHLTIASTETVIGDHKCSEGVA